MRQYSEISVESQKPDDTKMKEDNSVVIPMNSVPLTTLRIFFLQTIPHLLTCRVNFHREKCISFKSVKKEEYLLK